MKTKKWVAASDHGGVNLRLALIEVLESYGVEVEDLGPEPGVSVDYPDFGAAVGKKISDGSAECGLLVCGSGIGISIAANRFSAVRAALIHDETGARLSREHNNANVVVFGERTTGPETAKACLKVFLETEFAGGRHEARVNKLSFSEDS
ncbi:MAG: ribose 5-phosphate isomerase B [Alphaproteobacteria bacterium]